MTTAFIVSVFLIVLSTAAAAPPPVPAALPPFSQVPAASPTSCRLQLEGYGSKSGLKSASLECSGAVLNAAASPQLLSALGPQARSVKWFCSSDNKCLLSICSSAVTFRSPVIKNILVTDPGTTALICIGDNSSVVMQSGTFSDWHSPETDTFAAINVTSSSASLMVSNTTFFRDAQPATADVELFGGALMAVAGETTVLSSSFVGGKAFQGGAIVASGDAQVDIGPGATGVPTTFRRNTALQQGGDMSVNGTAHVRVYGAELVGAEAGLEGSLHVSGNSTVELFDTTIANATAQATRGGIGVSGSATLNMVRSTLTGCKASGNAGGLSIVSNSVVTLTDCTISNNVAGSRTGNSQGIPIGAAGGIVAQGSARLTLQDTRVTGNAAAIGGGMVIRPDAQLWVQGNTAITGNEAWERGGGVEMLTNSLVGSFHDLEKATRGNIAPKDPDISLPADKLQVLGTSSTSGNSTAQAFLPGDTLVLNVSIAGPNAFGKRRSNQTVTVALLTARNVSIYVDRLQVDASSPQQVTASARVMIRQPPGRYRLRLSTDNEMLDNDNKTVDVDVRVVECPIGYATPTSDRCDPCVRGYFSFNSTDKNCSWCPANAECAGIHSGLPQVWPAQGRWHSAPNSIQMHRCLNPKACMPKAIPTRQEAASMSVSEYKASQCSQEYQGNLCGDCALPNFGKTRPFFCRKCLSRPVIISLYILAACAMTGLIKLMLYFEQRSTKVSRQGLQQTLPEELLRVCVLHGQWLYIISFLVGVPWPATLAVPLQILTGLWSTTSGASIGFECVLRPLSRLPLGIQKELLCLLTPLAIMCVIMVFEMVLHYVNPTQHAKASDKLFSLGMCVVFLFLPTWLNSMFSLFTCVQLDKNDRRAMPPYQAKAVGRFWVHDMSQQCYSGYHKAWAFGLGVPLLLLLCVVLPAGVFVFMWRSRRDGKLDNPAFIRHYGFMYRLFREGVCWYESLLILQTAGLVLVATLGFSLGTFRQSLVTCAVLGCVIVLLLWMKPYACRPANHVAVASACVLFVTAYSALSFLPYEGEPPSPKYTNTMGVVVLLANVGFLCVAGWKLFQAIDWHNLNQKVLHAVSTVSGGKLFISPSTPSQLAGARSGDCESIAAAPSLQSSKDYNCSARVGLPPKESVP